MTPRRLPIVTLALPLLAALLLSACSKPLVSDSESAPLSTDLSQVAPENRAIKPRRSPIEAGERVPAFVWTDQAGRAVNTSELTTGGDALLIFTPSSDAPQGRPVFEWIRKNRKLIQQHHCEILVVTPDPPARNAEVSQAEDLHVALLADPASWGAHAFGIIPRGQTAPVERPHCVIVGREGVVLDTASGLYEPSGLIAALTVRRGAQDSFRAIDLLKK